MRTVYIDELILVNLIIDFFLLLCVENLLRIKGKKYKIFLAALFGACYSAAVFLGEIGGFLSTVLAAAVMVWCAFSFDNIKIFLRRFVYLYIVSFVFSGVMNLSYRLFYHGGSFYVANGVLYFDVSVPSLLFYSGICYLILSLFCFFFNRQTKSGIYRVKIVMGNKHTVIPAIVDSGNSLSSIGGRKVMVIEKDSIRHLFDPDQELDTPGVNQGGKFCFIPYHSVGKTGMLTAFSPDGVYILQKKHKEQKIADLLIGICETKLSSDGRYKGLLPCDAAENLTGGEKNEEIHEKAVQQACKNRKQDYRLDYRRYSLYRGQRRSAGPA